MKHGLRILLVVALLAAAVAPSANAYVYWSIGASGGTTLGRANLDGSGITHALVNGASNPGVIAVDAGHIYWANASTFTIGRANLDGSAANPTWLSLPGVTVGGLATDSTYIYWTDGSKYIGRARLDLSSLPQKTFINTGSLVEPAGLALQSGTLYFGTSSVVASVPAGGGTPTQLAVLPVNTTALAVAVSGNYLYLTEDTLGSGSSSIARIQTNGAGGLQSYVTGLSVPTGLATDGTYLYWADRNAIGRAQLGTSSGVNPSLSFIGEPNGAVSVAVDSHIDSTQTSVSCVPAVLTIGTPATCTATVTDPTSAAPPAGTVNLTSNGTAFFSGNPCTLTPTSGSAASCAVGAVATAAGSQSITATYGGDTAHAASAGSTTVCAGAGCTPVPPPAPTPTPTPAPQLKCVVPKLKGKTLAEARTLLRKAHCALGKVTKPKARKGRTLGKLVVGTQTPAAGRRLRNGTKVAVHLVAAPKHKR